MNKNNEFKFAVAIILLAVMTRFIPHLPNFVPITAIALFSGCYFSRFWRYLIPLSAMLLSDIFLGFSDVTLYVYLAMVLAVIFGQLLQNKTDFKNVFLFTLASSFSFFLITNFGVWMAGWYGYGLTGLLKCFVLAIPFFRYSLAGDLFYVLVTFGAYKLITNNSLAQNKLSKTYTIK